MGREYVVEVGWRSVVRAIVVGALIGAVFAWKQHRGEGGVLAAPELVPVEFLVEDTTVRLPARTGRLEDEKLADCECSAYIVEGGSIVSVEWQLADALLRSDWQSWTTEATPTLVGGDVHLGRVWMHARDNRVLIFGFELLPDGTVLVRVFAE